LPTKVGLVLRRQIKKMGFHPGAKSKSVSFLVSESILEVGGNGRVLLGHELNHAHDDDSSKLMIMKSPSTHSEPEPANYRDNLCVGKGDNHIATAGGGCTLHRSFAVAIGVCIGGLLLQCLSAACSWFNSYSLVLVVVVLFIGNAWWIVSWYQTWEYDFGGGRKYKQEHQNCPSFKKVPLTPGRRTQKRRGTRTSSLTPGKLFQKASQDSLDSRTDSQSQASSLSTPGTCNRERTSSSSSAMSQDSLLSDERHDGLLMDFVYIPFSDFLWCCYFVLPNAIFLWFTAMNWCNFRAKLVSLGWLRAQVCDESRVVARLILESMQVMQFTHISEESDGSKIGTFLWRDFPMLDNNGDFQIGGDLSVEVNLTEKVMKTATLNSQELSTQETMILIWHHTVFGVHVREHSMGNWGVNVNEAVDSFVRRNSIVTAMYNYFGYTLFPRMCGFWLASGISKHDLRQIGRVTDHSISQGVQAHGDLAKLREYSDVVNFVLPVRNYFLHEFAKWKDELFPGIDGEALFVGSILHSLDHSLMVRNLEDPLWLDAEHSEYGAMAELGRFTRVGFAPDLPGLSFVRSYKNATHPFYQSVYRFAAKRNKELADYMDSCSCK
jgi:hypothetical protein